MIGLAGQPLIGITGDGVIIEVVHNQVEGVMGEVLQIMARLFELGEAVAQAVGHGEHAAEEIGGEAVFGRIIPARGIDIIQNLELEGGGKGGEAVRGSRRDLEHPMQG